MIDNINNILIVSLKEDKKTIENNKMSKKNIQKKIRDFFKLIKNHLHMKKELYSIISFLLVVLTLLITSTLIYNILLINKNKDFYTKTQTIKYEQLLQDLKDKKIEGYAKNILYPQYLEFKDIYYSLDQALKVVVYKFSYSNGKERLYIVDSLKLSSLDSKDNKDLGNLLYNIENRKGEVFDLADFTLSQAITTLLIMGGLILILLVGQMVVTEMVSGKNFDKKVLDLDITFDEIIGYEEVKENFKEIISYIKDKSHYDEHQLEVPKGILLTGDPGVGKTMFAKAFANEVNATLFFASGADFAELYVGVGAKRVRNLFRNARMSAPAIIFIDEFDAIGNRETMGNDTERLSVVNQLLTEMDGLNKKEDIFVIATTNYENKIDKALLRPGRIDKKINIPLPDKETRIKIIQKYLGNYIVHENDLKTLGLRTQFYSGSSLKNLVDETKSLHYKKYGQEKTILLNSFAEVQENNLLGLKQKIEVKEEQEKRIAYHEIGHALISYLFISGKKLEKVVIEPRGGALGYTWSIQTEEMFLYSKEDLLNNIKVLLAGQAAEEIFMKSITNGSSDDLFKANTIAKEMIIKYGMGSKYPLYVETNHNTLIQDSFKEEISEILQTEYILTKEILEKNKEKIEKVFLLLIEKKQISGEEFIAMLNS